jgi:hypothetical protein
MSARIAVGGKPVYGARLGLLVLDARIPRIPGDVANAKTWPFPVIFRVVHGATAKRVVHDAAEGLLPIFLEAADALMAQGVAGIATTGGYMSIFQKEIAAHCSVPVASSSLMQIPVVQNLLPANKRVGVLTVNAPRLTPAHLVGAGAPGDTPVVGTEHGRELTRVMLGNEERLDCALAELDMFDAAETLLKKHPDVGALVLECHNMAPYSRAVSKRFGLPVYDVYTFLSWFHSGLSPRSFGFPGSGEDDEWTDH